jgi:hypothetical protein
MKGVEIMQTISSILYGRAREIEMIRTPMITRSAQCSLMKVVSIDNN